MTVPEFTLSPPKKLKKFEDRKCVTHFTVASNKCNNLIDPLKRALFLRRQHDSKPMCMYILYICTDVHPCIHMYTRVYHVLIPIIF